MKWGQYHRGNRGGRFLSICFCLAILLIGVAALILNLVSLDQTNAIASNTPARIEVHPNTHSNLPTLERIQQHHQLMSASESEDTNSPTPNNVINSSGTPTPLRLPLPVECGLRWPSFYRGYPVNPHTRGAWPPLNSARNKCGFVDLTDDATEIVSVLDKMGVIHYRGDSTLRQLASRVLKQLKGQTLDKKDANMTTRVERQMTVSLKEKRFRAVFRFDFLLENFLDPMKSGEGGNADVGAVVVSLGVHYARELAFAKARVDEDKIVQVFSELIDKQYSFSHSPTSLLFIFVGQNLECEKVRTKINSERWRQFVDACPLILSNLGEINRIVRKFVVARNMENKNSNSNSRPMILFMPPLNCTAIHRRTCTNDGMHSKDRKYEVARNNVLFNLMRIGGKRL
eukprot:PhM_4_TR14400/c0_g2_i1/m.29775